MDIFGSLSDQHLRESETDTDWGRVVPEPSLAFPARPSAQDASGTQGRLDSCSRGSSRDSNAHHNTRERFDEDLHRSSSQKANEQKQGGPFLDVVPQRIRTLNQWT